MATRTYAYVGPPELIAKHLAIPKAAVAKHADLVSAVDQFGSGPLTYVVDLHGTLRLAPREVEHVQVASGEEVRAAGEIEFDDDLQGVCYVSNQSTGYCPEPSSIDAVANAIAKTGLNSPDVFTSTIVFRRCPACQLVNLIKDEWFVCTDCESEIPRDRNI